MTAAAPSKSFIAVALRAVAVALFTSFITPSESFSAATQASGGVESPSAGGGGTDPSYHFVILGGTGRIGTAVASHLLARSPSSRIVLVGRDESRGRNAVSKVLREAGAARDDDRVTHRRFDFRNADALSCAVSGCDCLVHVAGPFLGEEPTPLRAAINSERCRCYVDVSDPLDFLAKSLELDDEARGSGTTAILAAGAFPGLSNVLAMDAAASLPRDERIEDVRFNYFTAGLGGSGDVNLYITNLGFGEPMVQHDGGTTRPYRALSGSPLGKVSFFLEGNGPGNIGGFGNDVAKDRIGARTVFAWPFPEAATVPRELNATGDSSAAMGTAPDAWNVMLGALVSIVPRPWWRSKRFSKFLADFSQPLVKATDALLKLASPDGVGETHAMRVDVTTERGSAASVVQAHESFRRCVGQSCAEFALDALEDPSPGVRLPEQRYRDEPSRRRILGRLTRTPGTIAYTGPVLVNDAPPPTEWREAIEAAERAEAKL